MRYISSKEFSKLCDLIICHDFNDTNVINISHETPKRLYITGEYDIFTRFLINLKNYKDKFELVYHHTDKTFDRFAFESIKPYVKHIYAENCEISHPMITKLPLGFRSDIMPERLPLKKDIKCYLNVGLPNTHELKFILYRSIRQDCLDYFKTKKWCKIEENVSFSEFNENLNRSKFVICPMGFGIDTCRFYESAYLGCTPIVMSSGLDDLYKKFNALIVNSWEEVTEELLENYIYEKPDDKVFDINTYISTLN